MEMNLLHITREQICWLFSLIQKVRGLTPLAFTSATTAFLFSQFFFVLSFFLPLKAILLLAVEGVPWYLSSLVTVETKDVLVLGIAIAAIASYGLHLLSGQLLDRAVQNGSRSIIGKSNKLHLFDNQADLARDGYRRLCQIVGSVVIVTASLALGLLINPLPFAGLTFVIVLEYGVLYLLLKSETQLGKNLSDLFRDNLRVGGDILSSSNFLIGFAILFGQFMAAEQRNIIVAILCILLMRVLTQRMRIGVQDLAFLSRNGRQLDALFYTSVPYTPLVKQYSFLPVLSISSRNHWLASALGTILRTPVETVRSTWLDSNMPGVAYFEVEASFPESEPEHSGFGQRTDLSLVKCYDKKRVLGAAHEIQLFTAISTDIPGAPPYIGDTFIGDTRILLFEGLPRQEVPVNQWRRYGLSALFRLWSVKPDDDLLNAYLRTHPTITTRLSSERLAQLWIAADDKKDNDALQSFFEAWPEIKEKVERSPLVINNPGFVPSFCRLDERGCVWCFSWNRWGIEPMGCNNLLLNSDERELRDVLDGLDDARIEIPVERLLLVSRLLGLETALLRNRLREAMGIVDEIMAFVKGDSSNGEFGQLIRAEP